jgi:predicted ATP-dependent protease
LSVRPRRDARELSPEALRVECDPSRLKMKSTADVTPREGVVGQARAREALQVAVGVRAPGWNAFVVGPPSTGRRTLVREILERVRRTMPAPPDVCYLHDPNDPDSPSPIRVPAGAGPAVARRVREAVAEIGAGRDGAGAERALVAEAGPEAAPALLALVGRARASASAGSNPAEDVRHVVAPFVHHDPGGGAPVVWESRATYRNLLGRVERRAVGGALTTDHTMLHAGALQRASGGFLVLDAAELYQHLEAYEALRRALRDGEAGIEDVREDQSVVGGESLHPRPMPLDVKVILIGSHGAYHGLLQSDQEMTHLLRVKAEIDDVCARDAEGEAAYAGVIARHVRDEGLRPVAASGVARLIEFGAELAADRTKLSLALGVVVDVLREANHVASVRAEADVGREAIESALAAAERRVDLVEERTLEMIQRGTLHVATTGSVVGQVNGLAVFDVGDHYFARPMRITAAVGPGREGLIDVERESELSGPTHTKGVVITQGYLSTLFGYDEPVTMRASVCFEQSYGLIEGDSASAAELCAILSALANVPVLQGVALTGSLTQRGELQAIGDVTRKVEGFFRVCERLGLDGTQGVVIPKANEDDLMLRPSVVEAVRRGRFHVWSARRVEDAIELLTGVPAGAPGPEGFSPKESVLARARARLVAFSDRLRRDGK